MSLSSKVQFFMATHSFFEPPQAVQKALAKDGWEFIEPPSRKLPVFPNDNSLQLAIVNSNRALVTYDDKDYMAARREAATGLYKVATAI